MRIEKENKKERTGRIWIAVILAAMLIAAVVCCALLYTRKDGERQEAKAATMPEQGNWIAPSESTPCGCVDADGNLCSKAAYRITNYNELAYVIGGADPGSVCYLLDFPKNENGDDPVIDISAWADQSIGSLSAPYSGHFNGNGQKIVCDMKGAVTQSLDAMGLFPYLKNAAVRNLNLKAEHSKTSSDANAITGIVTCQAENSLIENVFISETFYKASQTKKSGAVAGKIDATSVVRDCYVTSTSSSNYLSHGGIVGRVEGGTVEGCTFVVTGTRISAEQFGGIALELMSAGGDASTGNILNCKAYYPVAGFGINGSSTSDVECRVGGIVGTVLSGNVKNCTAEVSFSSNSAGMATGGIAGICDASSGAVTISNCRAYTYKAKTPDELSGTFTAGKNAGGIVGMIGTSTTIAANPVTIENCTADLSAVGSAANLYADRGGIVGSVVTMAKVSLKDCTSTASVYGAGNVGGLVGSVVFNGGKAGAFAMENCHSYGKTVSTSAAVAGGAVGRIQALSVTSDSMAVLVTNCSVKADVSATSGGTTVGKLGGFLGHFAMSGTTQSVFTNCVAYGNVTAALESGGFFGYLEGTVNTPVLVDSCSAYGDVTGTGTAMGGFIGYNGASGNWYGCTALGSVSGSYYVGGFIGRASGTNNYGGTSRASGCFAFGDVTATGEPNRTSSGGFVGVSDDKGANNKYNYCTAAGNVEVKGGAANSASYIGGFAGEVYNVDFSYCSASGWVRIVSSRQGSSDADVGYSGGFVGWLGGTTSKMESCTAYGDVISDVINMHRRGGLIGNIGCNATISNCVSYGNVVANKVCAVLGGMIGSVTNGTITVTSCTSYGTVTTGLDSAYVADLLARISSGSVTFKSCRFVDTAYNTIGQGSASVDATNSGMKDVKIPSAAAVKNNGIAGEQSETTISLTFSNYAGYRMDSLYLSLDGGKNYTQLVWDSMPLIFGISKADLSDLGGADGADKTLRFTYAAKSSAENILIRMEITAGGNSNWKIL